MDSYTSYVLYHTVLWNLQPPFAYVAQRATGTIDYTMLKTHSVRRQIIPGSLHDCQTHTNLWFLCDVWCYLVRLSAPSSTFHVVRLWTSTAALESLGLRHMPTTLPLPLPRAAWGVGVELLGLLSPLILPNPSA